ncbi:hypothetical protein EJ07DRAFT_117411, partial [Lizonia empirigonia]
TGLIPFDPQVVLKRFKKKYGPEPKPAVPTPVYAGKDWQAVDAHLSAAVGDRYSEDAVVVKDTLHYLSIQNQLLEMENSKLQQALYHEKRGTKKKRPLPDHRRQSWEAETEWWSPSRVNRAQKLQADADEAEKADEIGKADAAQLKKSTRLLKQKLDAEKKERRENEKKKVAERRANERAEIDARKAERARQKEERDCEKAIQLSQRGKRKASQATAPKKKQNRGTVAARSRVAVPEPAPKPRTHTTRSGRTATLYK